MNERAARDSVFNRTAAMAIGVERVRVPSAHAVCFHRACAGAHAPTFVHGRSLAVRSRASFAMGHYVGEMGYIFRLGERHRQMFCKELQDLLRIRLLPVPC